MGSDKLYRELNAALGNREQNGRVTYGQVAVWPSVTVLVTALHAFNVSSTDIVIVLGYRPIVSVCNQPSILSGIGNECCAAGT